MGKANKGGKPGLNLRRKMALARLEAQYAEFKAAGEDKAPRTTSRGSKVVHHKAVPFDVECKRMASEISRLKTYIH